MYNHNVYDDMYNNSSMFNYNMYNNIYNNMHNNIVTCIITIRSICNNTYHLWWDMTECTDV